MSQNPPSHCQDYVFVYLCGWWWMVSGRASAQMRACSVAHESPMHVSLQQRAMADAASSRSSVSSDDLSVDLQ